MTSCTARQAGTGVGVGMGQIAVARGPDCLTAVLGSCVGVALYHPRLQFGALAHVVLPNSQGQATNPGKFADTAVPHMLLLLATHQVGSSGLIAKLAGGAQMFGSSGPMRIGDGNVQAVTEVLQARGIRVARQDVGGTKGRRITFDLSTGIVTVESPGDPPRTL